MAEFLLEVRMQEAPGEWLMPAAEELRQRLLQGLASQGLEPNQVEVGFTPRRLVVVLQGLPGVAGGRRTLDALGEIVPGALREFPWPEAMRWGEELGVWCRPVVGIVALFDGEPVPFEAFGLEAGSATCGHPVLSPRPFKVKDAADHERKLKARGIEIRFEKRQRGLERALSARARELAGTMVKDPELLDRLAASREMPGVVQGGFDPELLSLPRELVMTCLRERGGAFAVETGGTLVPFFLAVMDRKDDPRAHARAGYQWVVENHLRDARFLYQQDRKVPLAERVARLEGLTFHDDLGTYGEKARRLVALCEIICQELGWGEETEAASEGARLLKTDLTTRVVKAYPALEGVMGGIYAKEEGYPEAVWQAIYDQYRSCMTADSIPRGRIGGVVALADRLDTLVGIFGLGLDPELDDDPYGARERAQEVVGMLLEAELALDLDLVAARAARLYGDLLVVTGEQILGKLHPFLYERLRRVLAGQGYSRDEIDAVLAAAASNLPDVRARVQALHGFRRERAFPELVMAARRISSILQDSPEHTVAPELLAETAEQDLFWALEELKGEIEEEVAAGQYDDWLRQVAKLVPYLDRFFAEVLVMDENETLRENRLALLQAIHRLIARKFRLSNLVLEETEDRRRKGRQVGPVPDQRAR